MGSRPGLGRGRSGLPSSHLPCLKVHQVPKAPTDFRLYLAEPFSYVFLGEGAVGLSRGSWGCEAEVSSAHFRGDRGNSLVPGPTPHAEGPATLTRMGAVSAEVQFTLLKLRLKAKMHPSNIHMAQSLITSPPQPLPCPLLLGAV